MKHVHVHFEDDGAIASVSAMKRLHGLDVVIESPKGTVRRGNTWEVVMPADYGYIRRTLGGDEEQVDCFVGSDHESTTVCVVTQINPRTSQFDEHKCLLGFKDMTEAMDTYFSGYSDGLGWKRVKEVHQMSMQDFRRWLEKRR